MQENDEATWVPDGTSDPSDAQNPTDAQPDYAYRLDAPGFDPDDWDQCAMRADFRETVEWHDGSSFKVISHELNGLWYASITSVLPNGAMGGENSHGDGAAGAIPNNTPVANAGPDQTKDTGDTVQLNGTGSADADNDLLSFKWTQIAGTFVTLNNDTSRIPTFTAPNNPTVIKFRLDINDICKQLYWHQSGNYTASDEVTITVE